MQMSVQEPLLGLAGLVFVVALVVLVLLLRVVMQEVRIPRHVAEAGGVTPARKSVGYGWVMERIDENNYVLHVVKLTSDGWAVAEKAGKSWLVRGIKPLYVEVRRLLSKRVIPMWMVERDGKVLDIEIDETSRAKARQLPPELSYAVINSKLLQRVARVVAQDYSLLLYGMFLGLGLAVLLVLVVLPMVGVPVQIGAKPIDVRVELPSQPLYQLPPPGNYTVHTPGVSGHGSPG